MTSTDTSALPALPFGIAEIQRLLPHRYPFLLIDRVVEFEPETRVLAYKNLTINEPFFQGHFPGHPVMPGVLIVEALAQAGGVLDQMTKLSTGIGLSEDKLFYLVKVDNVRFSRMVVPGDRLDLEVKLKRRIRNMAMYEGVAMVDGRECACADYLCAEAKA
jgi:3-hydroxyacyl-[acyl-carrier-protein] dehydratase